MSAWLSTSWSGSLRRELPVLDGACCRLRKDARRWQSSAAHEKPVVRSNGHSYEAGNSHERERLAQREFFFDVLNASATRRDAKQYLARFKSPVEKQHTKPTEVQRAVQQRQEERTNEQWRLQKSGVNLGELYLPTRAAAESPTFLQDIRQDARVERGMGEIHVALVCIRSPHLMDDDVLDGIALTLSQLVRLDMQIAVVLNCEEELSTTDSPPYKDVYRKQADRLVSVLELHNNAGARYVDSALSQSETVPRRGSIAPVRGSVAVGIPNLILEPLRRGAIPVVPGIAHTATSRARQVSASDVMLALTRTFSGIAPESQYDEFQTVDGSALDMSLDRIIMLDPLGGLPSGQREDGVHVFVNLDQEYDEIRNELSRNSAKAQTETLDLVRGCLALLPPSSSAMLISPEEAASVSRSTSSGDDSIGISTRRQKNPLIHNLLTNKPMISSSLPVARLSAANSQQSTDSTPTLTTRSTLVKRGMPVKMVPDPRTTPWTPPKPGEATIALEDHPDINFPRLLALIEDSFRRPLDVQHYLSRIRNRVAGVIIAGEYEGGAILTWEEPPPSSSSPSTQTRLVPYLDKFAVLQRSQGSSGVADIVFQAMVRTCFPNGVCWRSRQDNPVNKWYFERSRGTWQLEGSQWTMFWTNDDLVQDRVRWEDYVAVCRKVVPSWADNKKKPD